MALPSGRVGVRKDCVDTYGRIKFPVPSAENIYSESEVVIGSAFGKPLYRKCFRFASGNVKDIVVPHGIEDIDISGYCSCYGSVNKDGTTQVRFVPVVAQASSTSQTSAFIDNTSIYIYQPDTSSRNYNYVIEYQKLTD